MKSSNRKSVSETVCCVSNPSVVSYSATGEAGDVLSQMLRNGAQQMLQTALQKEVDEFCRIEPAS